MNLPVWMRVLELLLGLVLISAGTPLNGACQIPSATSPGERPLDSSKSAVEQLVESGRLVEAKKRLEQEVASIGKSSKTLYFEGMILFKENQHLESLRKLGQSLELNKEDPEVYKLIGLNWVVLERLDLAEPFLKEATRRAPIDPTAHYYLGRFYYTGQRFSEAEGAFRQALNLDPSFVKGYDNLGLALEALGREDTAIQAYRRAIELCEQQSLNYEWPYLNLGKFLSTKNRYEESVSLLQKAVQLNAKSAEAFYALGKALNKLRRDVEALKWLQRSIHTDPNYSEAHYLLSRIYFSQGRKEEARKEAEMFEKTRKASRMKPSALGN